MTRWPGGQWKKRFIVPVILLILLSAGADDAVLALQDVHEAIHHPLLEPGRHFFESSNPHGIVLLAEMSDEGDHLLYRTLPPDATDNPEKVEKEKQDRSWEMLNNSMILRDRECNPPKPPRPPKRQ